MIDLIWSDTVFRVANSRFPDFTFKKFKRELQLISNFQRHMDKEKASKLSSGQSNDAQIEEITPVDERVPTDHQELKTEHGCEESVKNGNYFDSDP